ncbi:MAG: hypothetical protein IJY08_00805 [Clostridia bacterium]|nr:hypothetical protein [Clostridia bacterium]
MSGEKNLWEVTADGNMITQMRLLDRDEKYINEKASDFEMLEEWLRIFPQLKGNKHASDFAKRLDNAMGSHIDERALTASGASALWRIYNGCECELDYSDDTPDLCFGIVPENNFICGEKDNISVNLNQTMTQESHDRPSSFEELANNVIKSIKSRDSDDICHICLALSDDRFVRPDRYHAGVAASKLMCGEKCNKKELDVLICQIVCELICHNVFSQIHLHIKASLSVIGELAAFLSAHNMSARIYAACDIRSSPSDILNTCLRSTKKCYITPHVFVSKNDTVHDTKKFLSALANIYPIGAVNVTISSE